MATRNCNQAESAQRAGVNKQEIKQDDQLVDTNKVIFLQLECPPEVF
jgi:hypothetical protein